MNMHTYGVQEIERIGVGPYDALYASRPDNILWGNRPSRLIKRYLDLSRPIGAALDVGCGDGVNAAALEAKGFEVLGVEISTLALRGLRNRFIRNRQSPFGNYLNEDVANLLSRSRGAKFDLIVSCGLFHCLMPGTRVQHHRTLFDSFLAPGGMVAFSVLTDTVLWPDGHRTNGIHPTTRQEIDELFKGWTAFHTDEGIIDDVHYPLIGPHKHSVYWTLAGRN